MSTLKTRRCVFVGLLVVGLVPAVLGRSDAKPTPDPVVPKYTDVKFSSGGESIKVWQYVPGAGDGPFPGIVLLNGIDGLDLLQSDLRVQMLYRTLASKLAQQGYVVHFVHYFNRTPFKKEDIAGVKDGFMMTTKKENRDKPFNAKLEQHFRDWMATVKDGVAFLREDKKLVNPDRIAVVGLSMGGFVGTTAAVEYSELKLAALANIFGGLPPQAQAKVRKEKMKLPPLLIMAGEEDEIVPEVYQREMFQLWRETGNLCEAHFYGGVGHAFYDKRTKTFDQDMALNEALPTAQRFLKRNLQN
jgi:dienelactone hydrolase